MLTCLESSAAVATESTDLPPSLFNSFPLATEAEGARRKMGVAAPPVPLEAPV